MKKFLFPIILSLVVLMSCEDDSNEGRVRFTLDGVDYVNTTPNAIISLKGSGLYDITINANNSAFLMSITLVDVALTTVYNSAEYSFSTTTTTLGSDECVPTNTTVVFDGLSVSSVRLDGQFTGLMCDGVNEFQITNGTFSEVPVL